MDFTGSSSEEEEFFEVEKFKRVKVRKSNFDFFAAVKKRRQEKAVDQAFDLTQELPASYSTFQIEGIPLMFSFTPYPSQLDIIAKIIAILQAPKENLRVESHTGTGKTMVLLCATLAWQASNIGMAGNTPTALTT